ncbi:LysR family transcriptional regulator [Actinomadura sp. CNU-125]|uniref:LysR family transcriptional regulator n=1 Tax=Actinomadura sp. CNU-125 TaxID=1904961 RepID=UPI0009FB8855|nr:LysR family transcriptional regulator [Actinomadura sp. CNU-125]
MNMERLRALHALSVHGTVAAAAEALHVTPSGVSQQLGKLEKETGHRLLEPQGRGVRLTRAGHVLAGHAARMLALLSAAQADLDGLREDAVGPVRLGSVVTAARSVLPPALTALRERFPGLSPTLRQGEAHEILSALVRRDLDVAIVESWDTAPTPIPAAVSHLPLSSDVVDLALPAGHPLARRRSVDLAELDGMRWAAWTAGGTCERQLVRTLREHGADPVIACNIADYPTQLAFVAAGLAAALIPRLGRDPVPAGVRVLATRPVVRQRMHVAWRTDADPPAVRACVEALRASRTGRPRLSPGQERRGRATRPRGLKIDSPVAVSSMASWAATTATSRHLRAADGRAPSAAASAMASGCPSSAPNTIVVISSSSFANTHQCRSTPHLLPSPSTMPLASAMKLSGIPPPNASTLISR